MEKKDKKKTEEVKPEKTNVSLEIGDRFIRLAEVKSLKGKLLFCFASKRLSLKEDKSISQEIHNLFKSLHIFETSVSLVMPRHLAISRIIRLPSIDEDEIREMVKIEAAKQMPYAAEGIISSYRIIEKQKDGYSGVLLSLVQEHIINRFIDILKNINVKVDKIALSSEALFNWYLYIQKESKKELPDKALLVVNIDSEYVDIVIAEKEKILFARALSHIRDRKNIADEIGKSITIFKKERNLALGKIIVTGSGNEIKELESVIRQELNIDTEAVAQTNYLEVDKTLEADLNEISFVSHIGLLIKKDDVKINLLPEKIIQENELSVFKKSILNTFILFLCTVFVLMGLITKKMSDRSKYLAIINSKIKSMEPMVEQAKKMKEDIEIIDRELDKKIFAAGIVSEIHKITPADISFNFMDYKENESLVLRGNASTLERIIKYITTLENSLYFENVKIKYTTKRMVENRQKTDFEIVAAISR